MQNSCMKAEIVIEEMSLFKYPIAGCPVEMNSALDTFANKLYKIALDSYIINKK